MSEIPAAELRGRVLRRARVAQGLTQEELALAAGVSPTTVGHLERGGRVPTATTAAKLVAALATAEREWDARLAKPRAWWAHDGRGGRDGVTVG
jgi:transcriptional regulator with XRE-family HTH domain